MKVSKIEIEFPVPVEFPPGFIRVLTDLVNKVCEKYEAENPTRVMWPAGIGGKPIWNEPKEPTFNSSVLLIDVFEREALPKEIARPKEAK